MSNTEEKFIKLKKELEAELQGLDDQIQPLLERRQHLEELLYGRLGSHRTYPGSYSRYRRFRVPSYTRTYFDEDDNEQEPAYDVDTDEE